MNPTATMTIRLPQTMLNRLVKLARATDRSKTYLATKALEEYIAAQEWQVQAIKAAVEAADAHDATFCEHDKVVAKMKKKISAAKKGK